jgi:hypothetical protein
MKQVAYQGFINIGWTKGGGRENEGEIKDSQRRPGFWDLCIPGVDGNWHYWYDIHLTAVGLAPGGSSTVHIYTQTIRRTKQLTNWEECVRAVPRLYELYPGICLTTEEKTRENLIQGSRRMPVGAMKTEYTEQSIHNVQYILFRWTDLYLTRNVAITLLQ